MPPAGLPAAVTVVYLGGHAARSERYMRDHWANAKGFLDGAGLEASRRQEEADHVALQQASGLGLLSPAYVGWEDILRILTREGGPVVPGRLTRTFETNTFHRQPQVHGTPAPLDAAEAFRLFRIPPGAPWVLTLPSPWDAACRSHDERRGATRDALAGGLADALRPLVDAAFARGATLVRFHDASALYPRAAPPRPDSLAEPLRRAAGSHARSCTLHLTNGDPFARPALLEANPLGGLSIEDRGTAAARPGLPNGLRLSVAALRGEESLVERPEALAREAASLAGRLGLGLWGITNGWDLDHVPHAIAARKVHALAQAKELVEVAA